MSKALFIKDDFLPHAHYLRSEALRLPFYDIRFPGGDLYRRIHIRDTDENKELLEAEIGGPIEQTYSFLRLNYRGELPKDVVHHDSELGGFVGLVYLTLDEHAKGGTALWRHRATKQSRYPSEFEIRKQGKSPKREYAKFDGDWQKSESWELAEMAEMKFNRLVVFPAECFHSRWPHDAFGSSPENGRLIWISFFQCKK